MIIFTNVGRLDNEEITFRRRALRDASSVVCYLIMFFLSFMNTNTTMGYIIQIMTLLPIVPQVVLAVLLFLGAVERRVPVLKLAIWMCVVIGGYNALLGTIGFAYYIRTGYLTMHFLLAVMFAVLAVSIFASRSSQRLHKDVWKAIRGRGEVRKRTHSPVTMHRRNRGGLVGMLPFRGEKPT
ncbi:hypothetical protein RR48_08755 [Papilio machaon]|uniref:Uncharacterized protein n=1 Tax=Papilio machaon TaxID=76193 RepID=A0A194RIJ6_PAPMA|nr:hypothetical protein RR48_08755 [Papilio machaon]